jgi:hypothetical protein
MPVGLHTARYYDPGIGRFVSADTIVPGNASGGMEGIALKSLTVAFHEYGFISKLAQENQFGPWFMLSDKERQQLGNPMGPANPQALNRYSYVQNNPMRYTDPSGHQTYNKQQAIAQVHYLLTVAIPQLEAIISGEGFGWAVGMEAIELPIIGLISIPQSLAAGILEVTKLIVEELLHFLRFAEDDDLIRIFFQASAPCSNPIGCTFSYQMVAEWKSGDYRSVTRGLRGDVYREYVLAGWEHRTGKEGPRLRDGVVWGPIGIM